MKKKNIVILIIVILISVGLFIVYSYHRSGRRAIEGRWFMQCQSNLKNFDTALKMYADDNEGRFPDKVSRLTPEYFRMIPTCDGGGRNDWTGNFRDSGKGIDTYSDGYEVSADGKHYTLSCKGKNHLSIGVDQEDYPRISSEQGLMARP